MIEFYVKVYPESVSFKIKDAHILKVFLTNSACRGRANTELIGEMAKILGEKPAIIHGHHSRRKKLKVDISEEELEEKLEEKMC